MAHLPDCADTVKEVDAAINIIEAFDSELRKNLQSLGVDFSAPCAVGVAVSGGADSIALLTGLCHLLPADSKPTVITLNHNLRPEAETAGDADFVQDYCRQLGVPCERRDIERGLILSLSRERGIGIEAAARELRYEHFADFLSAHKLSCLRVAHNQDDQLETLLMRFLQGSGVEALAGIQMRRGSYLRPMLSIPRSRIEAYLLAQHIAWRTDSSNGDVAMLRNRMRHSVLPVLDKALPGWRKSVLFQAGRFADDGAALGSLVQAAKERLCWRFAGGTVTMNGAAFLAEERAVCRRLLYAAFDAVGAGGRIPSSLVERVLQHGLAPAWQENAAGVQVECDGQNIFIFIEKGQNLATESGFLVIIERLGSYRLGAMEVLAGQGDGGIVLSNAHSSVTIPRLQLPFMLRSRQPGDLIKAADGSERPVAKILDDWKCRQKKDAVPLVQELSSGSQRLVCIWGRAVGFKDWIVKD